jgi:hypothetical protein
VQDRYLDSELFREIRDQVVDRRIEQPIRVDALDFGIHVALLRVHDAVDVGLEEQHLVLTDALAAVQKGPLPHRRNWNRVTSRSRRANRG